jgi:Uma2 family endonuclease
MQQLTIGTIHSDRYTQITDVTWEEYERLQFPNQLVSFFNGTITIMSPGRNHEIIGDLIRAVIWGYCRRIKLYPYTFNQTRLIEPGKEGKEPDVAYSFDKDKDTPDLAVEVNLTSGSINDLTKYKYLKIPEVWLWEKDKIKFFAYSLDGYLEIKTSLYLTGLESDRVSKAVKNSLSKSPLEIEQIFDSPETK